MTDKKRPRKSTRKKHRTDGGTAPVFESPATDNAGAKMRSRRVLWLVVGALLLVGLVAAAFWYTASRNKVEAPSAVSGAASQSEGAQSQAAQPQAMQPEYVGAE